MGLRGERALSASVPARHQHCAPVDAGRVGGALPQCHDPHVLGPDRGGVPPVPGPLLQNDGLSAPRGQVVCPVRQLRLRQPERRPVLPGAPALHAQERGGTEGGDREVRGGASLGAVSARGMALRPRPLSPAPGRAGCGAPGHGPGGAVGLRLPHLRGRRRVLPPQHRHLHHAVHPLPLPAVLSEALRPGGGHGALRPDHRLLRDEDRPGQPGPPAPGGPDPRGRGAPAPGAGDGFPGAPGVRKTGGLAGLLGGLPALSGGPRPPGGGV